MQAINLAVPIGRVSKHKYPAWFSSKLKSYIKKKNYFYRCYKKFKTDSFYDKFSSYRKLVKSTIKSDRSRWLKSIDENLKSHPQQFWKYVSQYREKRMMIQLILMLMAFSYTIPPILQKLFLNISSRLVIVVAPALVPSPLLTIALMLYL
jgi:hypothetical protein